MTRRALRAPEWPDLIFCITCVAALKLFRFQTTQNLVILRWYLRAQAFISNKGIPSHFLTCILGNNFFVKHVGRGVTLRGNSLAQTLFWKSTLAEAFKSCILQLCSLQTKKNIYSTKQSTELWCTTKFWNCSRYFYDQKQHLCIQEKLLYATIFVFESSLRLTKQRR